MDKLLEVKKLSIEFQTVLGTARAVRDSASTIISASSFFVFFMEAEKA